MPGISFVLDLDGSIEHNKEQILQSINSLIHTESYKREILFLEKFYFLGFTKYNEYPVTTFDSDDFYIYLEGKLYGYDNSIVKEKLNELAKHIFHKPNNAKNYVSDWLLNTDGDFIIFMIHKYSNKIFIINDAFSRLPIYYYKSDRKLILSRELLFVSSIINKKQFDTMSIAQYLLFGYPLGKRTLLEDIFRLEPASLIKIDLDSFEIEIERVSQFNFEEKRYKGINFNEQVNNLVELFCNACINRTNSTDKNIVSMSGGLDSRAVAAALHKENISFYGATYRKIDKTTDIDIKIAEQLANAFNIDLKIFNIGLPGGDDVFELLKIKSGLNELGMSFILPFFYRIKETFGNRMIYFTGDGGDKVLPDIRPSAKLKDLDELTDYIIVNNQIFSLDMVIALTKIDKSKIVSELKKRLMTYPEKDLHYKYVHFLIYEKGFKWLFEGEDRNRFYFWSVTPFYSIQFFNSVMNCPDSMKMNYKLYREFLIKLSHKASLIDNANWKMPITSKKLNLYLSAKNIYYILPSKLKRIINKRIKKNIKLYERNSEIPSTRDCFWEQVENCKSISKYLSISDLKKIKNISKPEFYNLFTITSIIENYEDTKSTIEKYYSSDFI